MLLAQYATEVLVGLLLEGQCSLDCSIVNSATDGDDRDDAPCYNSVPKVEPNKSTLTHQQTNANTLIHHQHMLSQIKTLKFFVCFQGNNKCSLHLTES